MALNQLTFGFYFLILPVNKELLNIIYNLFLFYLHNRMYQVKNIEANHLIRLLSLKISFLYEYLKTLIK
jgi:hypothetical protein